MRLFPSPFRNISRAREVIRVLWKYGYEDLVTNTSLRRLVSRKRLESWIRDDRNITEFSTWERIRLACEELGPTFIKGAQVMANRPDLLPQDLIIELKKLQSHVQPFPFEVAKHIMEREWGRPITEVFAEIHEHVLGSASIGQVYRAKLHSGDEVVVKIQRPEVAELIHTDLDILKEIVRRSEPLLLRNGVMNPLDIVESFERSMKRELQYTIEARNIDQFRSFYKNEKTLYVPRAYKEYTTEKVMVIEFVRGCEITNLDCLQKWGIDPQKIAETGLQLYLRQIFEYGYFHADPHPGNVLVLPDGRICLIDFGMVGSLLPKDKRAFAGVFVSMAQRNPGATARYLRALSLDDDVRDMHALTMALNGLIEDFASRDVSESSMAEMASRLQRVVYDHRLQIPGDIFLILRALAILEGIGKEIHPTFNTWDAIKPYGVKLVMEQFAPQSLAMELQERYSDVDTFLTSLPSEFRDILSQVRKGKLLLNVRDPGQHDFIDRITILGNRLIIVLLIGFVWVATAILAQTGRGDIPSLATTGFVLALLLSIGLLWNMWRRP